MDCDMGYSPSELKELRSLMGKLAGLRPHGFDLKHEELIHVTNQTDLDLLAQAIEAERQEIGRKLVRMNVIDIEMGEDAMAGKEPSRAEIEGMARRYISYFKNCADYGIPLNQDLVKASERWAREGVAPMTRFESRRDGKGARAHTDKIWANATENATRTVGDVLGKIAAGSHRLTTVPPDKAVEVFVVYSQIPTKFKNAGSVAIAPNGNLSICRLDGEVFTYPVENWFKYHIGGYEPVHNEFKQVQQAGANA